MSGTTTTEPPRIYTGPAVTEGGCLLASIPFQLNLSPLELRVQADRRTGLFSGSFEVGLQVQPGPAPIPGRAITELVTLFASGDHVQFLSQLVPDSRVYLSTMTVQPSLWDLRTGFVYDLVSVITISNQTPRDQVIFLSDNINLLDGVSQTVAALSCVSVTVLSGKTAVALLALKVTASVEAREDLVVSAVTGEGATLDPVKVIVDSAASAPATTPYQVTNPSSLAWTIGGTVSVTLATAHGQTGVASWGTDSLAFLADHGVRFSGTGTLVSDGTVRGPAVSRTVLVWVRNEIVGGGVEYAAKLIQISIS